MTEDTSPENLRKFLVNDDPAMRRMGLSMAKGGGVPDELYKNVFGLSLWDPEEENRKVSGELVEEIGLENIPEFPGFLEPFNVDDIDYEVVRAAMETLRKIGDTRAAGPLIGAFGGPSLGDPTTGIRRIARIALVEMAAVEPLIKALEDEKEKEAEEDNVAMLVNTALALGEIGDVRAVEPLIKTLEVDLNSAAAEALGKIGDERAIKPLIKALECDYDFLRHSAAEALGVFGNECAVEPLIKALKAELDVDAKWINCNGKWGRVASWEGAGGESAARALGRIGDKRALEPLVEALEVIDKIGLVRRYGEWRPGKGHGLFTAAVEALMELGDVRAVGPLGSALESDNLWFEHGDGRVDYHGFFTLPLVEAMIEIGIDKITENERSLVGAHLKLMLEIGSEEDPTTYFGDHFYDGRIAKLICEFGPTYCSHWRIDSCSGFIRDALWESLDEPFCELLIQNLENQTQPLIRIIEKSRGIYSRAAAKALVRQGWQPDTDELRANYLIATEQWDQCSNLGASAVEPLVRALESELAELRGIRQCDRYNGEYVDHWFEPIARALGMIGDARAVEPLIKVLEENLSPGSYEEEATHNATVEALGMIGDERAVEPLIEALIGQAANYPRFQPVEVATKALLKIGEPAVEPLIKALEDGNSGVAEILEGLGWKPETDELRVAYLLAKNDTEAFVKWGEPAVKLLIKALERGESGAAKALGRIGDARAIEPLIKALGDGNSSAAGALGMIGDARAVEPLFEALEADHYPQSHEVQQAAAEALVALGQISDTRLVAYFKTRLLPLIEALENEDVAIRYSAAMELANNVPSFPLPLEESDSVEPLIKALGDENGDIRIAAASALKGFCLTGRGEKDGHVIELLIRAFQEDPEEVRVHAARALKNIGKPAVEPLIKALGDENSTVRTYAAEALGMFDDVRAVEPLIKALEDEESNVRYSAAMALGEIGDKQAVEPLIKALEDEESNVRYSAAMALGEIGDKQAIEPLIRALGDDGTYVRKAAVAALDMLGWEPDTEQFQFEELLASSGLRFSDLPIEAQEGLADHCKLLLSHEKILNLEQEEFAKIAEKRNSSLETMETPCTAKELIELLTGASSQIQWIVACGVVEISCYDGAIFDKISGYGRNPIEINIFWPRISAYSNPITKADRDELVRVMKRLPLVLVVHISQCLFASANKIAKNKEASAVMKKNYQMLTTIFQDPDLAKAILGRM